MARGHTECPVPVRGRPVVAALVPQRVFKVFDKIAMPWQEETGEVDLVLEGLDYTRTDEWVPTTGLRSMWR